MPGSEPTVPASAVVSESLVINEIYLSVQGESTWAGLPCLFLRLAACNLRCSYCDTAYAFNEGRRRTFDDILGEITRRTAPYADRAGPPGVRLPLIEFTGGEPLLQASALSLMSLLCERGFTVLVETSGALDISRVDSRVRRIMDLKCPSSGEVERNRWENLPHLRPTDEVKFVIGTREDYTWMKTIIARYRLDRVCPLLVSWVHPLSPAQLNPVLKPVPAGQTPIDRRELVEALVAEALPVRFQAQLHKIIWPPELRGV